MFSAYEYLEGYEEQYDGYMICVSKRWLAPYVGIMRIYEEGDV